MRLALFSATLFAAFAGGASAQPPGLLGADRSGDRPVVVCDRSEASWMRACSGQASAPAAKPVKVARQVFVCDRTAETRRSWMREFGSMTFVTADELMAAEASNESWSAPRCMTNAEMRRFTRSAPGGERMAKALDVATGY